jgi:acyl carrier protein
VALVGYRHGMLLGELAAMLREVTGADAAWVASVTPDSRLDGDLWLDSVELAALGTLLRERYRIDLPAYLAGLDLDQLIELRVKDLVALAGTA